MAPLQQIMGVILCVMAKGIQKAPTLSTFLYLSSLLLLTVLVATVIRENEVLS